MLVIYVFVEAQLNVRAIIQDDTRAARFIVEHNAIQYFLWGASATSTLFSGINNFSLISFRGKFFTERGRAGILFYSIKTPKMNPEQSCESREAIDLVLNDIKAAFKSHLAYLHDKTFRPSFPHPQSFINHQKTSKPIAFEHKFKSHLALIRKTLPQKWFRR